MARWFYSLLFLLLGMPVLASPQQALAAALADAESLPPERRLKTRYLDATYWRIGEIATLENPLAFHTNQLSRSRRLVPLKRLDGQVYRIDLEEYGWDPAVWEKFANLDPYFHEQVLVDELQEYGYYQNGKWVSTGFKKTGKQVFKSQFALDGRYDCEQMKRLAKLTYSNAPLLDAVWWFGQTCRQIDLQGKDNGVGYYNFLGVKDRKTFFAIGELDEAKSIKGGFDLRGVLGKSGINQHGRQVGWFKAYYGAAYYTLDADQSIGRANPIRNLGRGDFKHKAEEWYIGLPNGLWAFFLGDQDGKIQNTAPDFIGADKSPLNIGGDGRIHICLSCIRCHTESGLRPVDDWARRVLRNPAQLAVDDYKKFLELTSQYFENLNEQIEADRAVYAKAVAKVNGLSPLENAKAYANLWSYYADREYGSREIADLMGVSEERLLHSLKNYAKAYKGRIDLVLVGLLAIPQEPMRVEHAEELLTTIWQIYGKYQ